MPSYKKQLNNCLDNLNKSIDELDQIMESECYSNISFELEEIKEQILDVIEGLSNIEFTEDEIDDYV